MKKTLEQTVAVSNFLMELSKRFRGRWEQVTKETGMPYPFGDLAYASALVDWYKKDRPKDAWFSYAPGEVEDPFMVAFKEELTREFGLPFLTQVEGEKRRLSINKPILTHNVTDWGPN